MLRLSDARVLITGASSGIGAEFARQLHSAGANLVLVARRADRLAEIAERLNAKRPNSVEVVVADLANSAELDRVADLIRNSRIDILINNAGKGSFGPYESLDLRHELELVRLNINATITLAHAVIPQLKKRRAGAIVVVSSIAAFQPLPYMATYAATKAFNYTHSHGLRAELRPYGVNVLAVCPGPTATEFGGVARVPGEMTNLRRDSTEMVVEKSIAAIQSGRGTVIPGLRSWIVAQFSRCVPVTLSTAITERILRGSLPRPSGDRQPGDSPN